MGQEARGEGRGRGAGRAGEAGYSQGTSGGGLAGSILTGAEAGEVLLLVREGTLAGGGG